MARSDFKFFFPKRVRYSECDPQGIVFNSRYLEYLDIGVTEYWRALGVYDGSPHGLGPEIHVVKNLVEYRKPILFDEMIDIYLRYSRLGNTSLTIAFEIHGAGAEDVRARGETVGVHVSEARGAPVSLPDWLVALCEAYEERPLHAVQR